MGSDIHLLFEERDRQGRWTTLFEPRPDAKYWFDQIIEEKMSNGSAALMFSDCGRMDTEEERRKVYDRTEDYFKSMTLDEAELRYGSHPQFCWDWYGRMPKPAGEYGPIIRNRNYNFFAAISGNRMEHRSDVFFPPRGTPEDIDRFYRMMVAYNGEDGHTHSWLMVSEMLSPDFTSFCAKVDARHRNAMLSDPLPYGELPPAIAERLKRDLTGCGEMTKRLDWLRRHLPHPERTRMLFHFDC